MFRRTSVRSALSFFTALFLLAGAGFTLMTLSTATAQAATVVFYDFDDGSGGFENSPDLKAAHVSSGSWTDAAGTFGNTAGNPGKAVLASHWADGNALQFAVIIDAGYRLTLDRYAFDQRASGTGPTSWSLNIAGIAAASGASAGSFLNESGTLAVTGLSDTFLVVLSGSGASSNSGTFRIDNFELRGQVSAVPLPASLGLLAAAWWSLIGLSRRRE